MYQRRVQEKKHLGGTEHHYPLAESTWDNTFQISGCMCMLHVIVR